MTQSLGQTAYEAYRRCSDGKSLATGAPIPGWDELPAEIQAAWTLAAAAVKREVALSEQRIRRVK